MTAVGDQNVIDLPDLDQPIYRTYSMRWFLDLLATGEDGLRNPSTWDDPFENFFLARTLVDTGSGGGMGTLAHLADDWYGQCWTTNCNTDAMWRIYSSGRDGVQVKTTVRKIFGNLIKVPTWSPRAQIFIGKVSYLTSEQLQDLMSKITFMDVASGGQGDGFAKLLCVKRTEFQHEQEVRLLYWTSGNPIGPQGVGGTVRYPLKANEVFDEILLDPRLTDSEAKAAAAGLGAVGWMGPAPRSTLYQVPKFVIPQF